MFKMERGATVEEYAAVNQKKRRVLKDKGTQAPAVPTTEAPAVKETKAPKRRLRH